jgi:hypothetical protein
MGKTTQESCIGEARWQTKSPLRKRVRKVRCLLAAAGLVNGALVGIFANKTACCFWSTRRHSRRGSGGSCSGLIRRAIEKSERNSDASLYSCCMHWRSTKPEVVACKACQFGAIGGILSCRHEPTRHNQSPFELCCRMLCPLGHFLAHHLHERGDCGRV